MPAKYRRAKGMSDKKVTIKFWQVVSLNEDGQNFSDAIKVVASARQEELVREIDEIPYQIAVSKADGGSAYIGDVIRLQGSALPSRLKKGGKAQKLELGRGEYLGYHTGFIYCEKQKILGFEIKPAAAGLHKLIALIADISKLDNFAPVPMIDKNDIVQLADSKNSRFSFKIADPQSLQALDPNHANIRKSLIELKGMVDGTYLNITVGAGRRKYGLEKGSLMHLAGWLLGEKEASRGGVKAVKAHQPGGAEKVLDFIKAQVRYAEVLPLTENPEANWQMRSDMLQKALEKARIHAKRQD